MQFRYDHKLQLRIGLLQKRLRMYGCKLSSASLSEFGFTFGVRLHFRSSASLSEFGFTFASD